MKISRLIMSLSLVATIGFALTGCDNTKPVELGQIAAPIDGEPDPSKSLYGIDGETSGIGGNRFGGGIDNPSGAPGGWGVGAEDSSLGHRSDAFNPVPGLKFEPIYFEFDRSDLRPSELDKLNKVAEFIRSRPELGIIVEGHCDDRGSEEYNRALGERRAISLRNQLVKLGVPDDNMKTVSFGEDRPAVPGTSAEARAKNRRGETIPAKMQ
ncbi:MAG: OmpA family protein [Victivallaceae bacterium]|nr:OmpA family protein [Victivallaceae bacterium]